MTPSMAEASNRCLPLLVHTSFGAGGGPVWCGVLLKVKMRQQVERMAQGSGFGFLREKVEVEQLCGGEVKVREGLAAYRML